MSSFCEFHLDVVVIGSWENTGKKTNFGAFLCCETFMSESGWMGGLRVIESNSSQSNKDN